MNDIGCKILPSIKIQWISLEILNYTLEVLYHYKNLFQCGNCLLFKKHNITPSKGILNFKDCLLFNETILNLKKEAHLNSIDRIFMKK